MPQVKGGGTEISMNQKSIRGRLFFIMTGILILFSASPVFAAAKCLGSNYVIDLRAGEAVFDLSEPSRALFNTFSAMNNNGVIGYDLENWGWNIYDLDQDGTKDISYIEFTNTVDGTELFSYSVLSESNIHESITLSANSGTIDAVQTDGYDYYEKLTFLFPEKVPVSLTGVSVTGIVDKEFTGAPITQVITVKLTDTVLREGIHFTVAYKDNTAPGTASVVISGKGNCSGTVTKSFQIKKTASDAVSNAILALKSADMITLADKAAVAAARQAFNGLSAAQRSLIPADRLKKLTDAEGRITALEKAAAEAAQKAAAEAAKKAAAEAAKKAAAKKKVVKGKVYTVSKMKYKVTNSNTKGKGTVTLTGTTVKKSKLQTLTIPATVKINGVTLKITAIGNNAFRNYTKLRTVSIGKNIRTIGKNAFFKCSKLKTIVIKTSKLTAKTVGANAFKGIYKKAVIKAPKAKRKAYTSLLRKRGIG